MYKYVFTLTLLLTGCAAGPDYKAPTINAPQSFVSGHVLDALNAEKDSSNIPVNWWLGFGDPMLNSLIDEALVSSPVITAALERVKAAEEEVNIAEAGNNLSVGLEGRGDASRREPFSGGGQENSQGVEGGLSAGLPIDLFGRTQRQVEAARAALEQAQARLRSAVLGTSTEIAQAYLALRGGQQQLELLMESVDLQEQTLDIVRSRFEAGIAPELDVRRAETSVANLRADIPPLTEELQNRRNRIATLAGHFSGKYEDTLQNSVPIPSYRRAIPSQLPLEVLKQRPDVLEAEGALKEAVARVGIAQTEYMPSLSLDGSITAIAGSGVTDALLASLSAMIDQVIYDGGARPARVKQAQAEANATLADYKNVLREASEDIESSLAAIDRAKSRITSLDKAAKASERSFFQAETLYSQGLISFLDVVDAQRVLASARQALASERTNLVTEIAGLFQALGAPN